MLIMGSLSYMIANWQSCDRKSIEHELVLILVQCPLKTLQPLV